MSRRYGRNQKRRALARIEQLELAAAALHIAASQARDSAAFARAELEHVREALGENFIGLSPMQIAYRLNAQRDPLDWKHPIGGENDLVTMHALSFQCRDESDRHEYQMHFRFDLAGQTVGYAVSEPAIRRTPPKHLARQLAVAMSIHLVDALRRPDREGRRA